MYEQFGARLQGKKVEFQLFLPDKTVDPAQYTRGGEPKIREVKLIGDFQHQLGQPDWDRDQAPVLQRVTHPHGQLYQFTTPAELADGFYQYKYFVEFENGTTRYCSDPCAKYGDSDQENENSAFVVGGNLAQAEPIAKRLPPADLVIYELMIDDFTSEFRGDRAPIDAVLDKLDYLKQLGVNAIECMPWTPWPGDAFSWGYDPFQFFAAEYRYLHDNATPLDKLHKLRMFVNRLHAEGMHVIMDGVFNHVRAGVNPNRGFPYLWLYQDPEDSPFIGAFAGGGFFEEFDYNNLCVEQFIRDVCLYWLDSFALDGIRFDYTLGFFRRDQPQLGITQLITDVKQHLADSGRENVALILEHLTDNRFESIDDTNKVCATNNWFDPFMFRHFDYARNGNIDDQLLRILDANLDYQTGKGPITYIQNHDHSTVVHEAGGRARWFKTQPAAIALLTSPGTVMIHNGQEFGEDKFLPGSGDGRVVPRPLQWNTHSPSSGDFVGQRLYDVYSQLIRIRHEHPALRSPNFFPSLYNHPDGYGAFTDRDVVVFHRYGPTSAGAIERFIVVVNYSDFDQRIDIPFPLNGRWDDLLNGGSANVEGFRLSHQKINSNWGRIYFRQD